MARESKSPRPRERETVDGHDQKRERERETVDGHDQKREREGQSMAMTKREQMVMSKRGNTGNY